MKLKDKTYLAKGKRGVVWTGYVPNAEHSKPLKVALKEKREDSEAINRIENEAKFLKLLNKHGIGSEFIDSGKNWLMYKFVEGEFIVKYLEQSDKKEIIRVLKEVFNQCRIMDKLGINKEEMHHPVKHIIIGESVKMIDFERCRYSEKVHNVTQFIQFCTGSLLTPILKKNNINLDVNELRSLAREYRENTNEEVYKKIIKKII